MDGFSIGDEVRFRTSPDIIDTQQTTKSHSWTRFTDFLNGRSADITERPKMLDLRLQAIVNKDGLIEMDLSSKELGHLPSEVYTLVRIEVLRINNNRLKSITSGMAKLHKLRILYANHNVITYIHDTLANCVHLQYLDLSDNKIAILPRSLGLLSKLKILKLGNNEIENLPHELGNLSSLRQLELPGNKLWHLPASFQRLQSLRCISLARNGFDQLPLCVCHMRSLEAIDLHGNRLHNLPPDVSNLKHLHELSLASNKFQALPFVVLTLKQLHSLDLSHNQLRSLPHRLSMLTKLQLLILADNQLVTLPSNIESLTYLNLANNRFENLSVVRMRQLKYLNLGHNNIQNMPLGVYNLSRLEVLKVPDNKLSYVSQDIALLKKLRILDLGNNKLTSLPQVIDELEHLEVFNIRGNQIETRKQLVGPPRGSYGNQIPGGNPMYGPSHKDKYPAPGVPNGFHHQSPHRKSGRGKKHQPVYRKRSQRKKRSVASKIKSHFQKKPFMSIRSTKTTATQHVPYTSAHIGTQYTPKSTLRSRDKILDEPAKPRNSLAASYNNSPAHQRSNGTIPRTSIDLHHIPNTLDAVPRSTRSSTTIQHPGVLNTNPFSVSEISYPMISTPVRPMTHEVTNYEKSTSKKADSSSYTHDWVEERRQQDGSGSSNSVTINEPIGDQLSLGEEDFEFVPTNIPDEKLMRLCHETEVLLNSQLLKPLQSNRGIFRKSMNEGGTLRTLHGITGDPTTPFSEDEQHSTKASLSQDDITKDIYLRRSMHTGADNAILRLKMDVFKVTPSGGLFKSSIDPNISLYFPKNAVSHAMAITIQIERISSEAVEIAKKIHNSLRHLLAVGDIIHIRQSREMDFREQVTLTIPAPPLLHHGNLHLVTYREDNTCTPCVSKYRVHKGYISLQTWHFSGRGAILTKTKDKFKACKVMEQLLQHLYV